MAKDKEEKKTEARKFFDKMVKLEKKDEAAYQEKMKNLTPAERKLLREGRLDALAEF